LIQKVKRAHYDPNAFVVRFYNPTKLPVDATLVFQAPVAAVFRSRLDEKKMRKLDESAPITVGPKKIVTVLVYPK
jgi:alpha-mannosidase